MNEEEKYFFLKEFVKGDKAIDELTLYAKNKFVEKKNNTNPLHEDLYIETWEQYFEESKDLGAYETLKKYIIPLQFPVEKGISKTDIYRDATLKGALGLSNLNLVLKQPSSINLEIYNSEIIGKVPVIIVPDHDDFNTIICALSNKNEPQEFPKSMGALFINGINNWDRIYRQRDNWLKQNPIGNWNLYFKERVLPKPYLYKDKLMVLSSKNYSVVKNESVGITEDVWSKLSLIIRREHECAHLFTLKYYGSMANNMHDEIIADYTGIVKALGRFNKEWFLHFVGLEDYPNYRKGGRLENYQGAKKLSEEAFEGLKKIVKKVSDTIYEFDNKLGKIKSPTDELNRIKSICEIDLISMASSKGIEKLIEKYNSIQLVEIV